MRLAAGISGMRTSSRALDERCQKIRRLEDKGPSFGVGLGLGVGDAIDLQPVGVDVPSAGVEHGDSPGFGCRANGLTSSATMRTV
jgi:hypothetical protein